MPQAQVRLASADIASNAAASSMFSKHPTSALLPIMPYTASRIRYLVSNGHSTNAEIEAVLLNDPGATLALYRALEKQRPGACNEASGPAHAVAMLGREAFRSIFRPLRVIDQRRFENILSPGFTYAQAAHAGWYARRIADTLAFGQASEMQVAALLQSPAIFALWQQDFEAAARASNAVRDGVSWEIAFSAEMGEPLAQANRRFARAWQLPELACQAAEPCNDPDCRQAQCIALATRMAQVAFSAWPDEAVDATVAELAELLPRRIRDPGNWWKRETVAAARDLLAWGYPLAAHELAQIPERKAVQEIPSVSKRAVSSSDQHCLQDILSGALKGLARRTGATRAIFAMPSRSREHIQTRLALGGKTDDALRRLHLPLQEKHLFSLLLAKPQAVYLNAENRQRFAPYLPPLGLDEQALAGFYATSVFVNERPLGILYADGAPTGEEGYKAFRQEAARITRMLESLQQKAA